MFNSINGSAGALIIKDTFEASQELALPTPKDFLLSSDSPIRRLTQEELRNEYKKLKGSENKTLSNFGKGVLKIKDNKHYIGKLNMLISIEGITIPYTIDYNDIDPDSDDELPDFTMVGVSGANVNTVCRIRKGEDTIYFVPDFVYCIIKCDDYEDEDSETTIHITSESVTRKHNTCMSFSIPDAAPDCTLLTALYTALKAHSKKEG